LQFLSLTFSGETGLLKDLTNTEKSLTVELSNDLLYYEPDGSGAYIFRPDGNPAQRIATSVTTSVIKVALSYVTQNIFWYRCSYLFGYCGLELV